MHTNHQELGFSFLVTGIFILPELCEVNSLCHGVTFSDKENLSYRTFNGLLGQEGLDFNKCF